MTTIKKIIERVDRKITNAYTDETKLEWIASLDGKIAMDVMLMDISEISRFNYSFPEDLNTQPLVQFPFDDLYDKWIAAQIAAQDEEWDRYANNMEVYNAYYEEFVNWFLSTYRPGQGHMGDGAPRPGIPTYYITAYGLAVMKGFRGTLDEWIASLKGEKGDQGVPGMKLAGVVVEMLDADAQPYGSVEGTEDAPVLRLGIPKQLGDFLKRAGGSMLGQIDMAGNVIRNLALPVKDGDAVNKQFLDDRYETALPKAAGVASAGQADTFSRGDHVHPEQKNAETAAKLKNAVQLQVDLANGQEVDFDGSKAVKPGVTGVLGGSHGGLGMDMTEVPANAILRKDAAGENLAGYVQIKSGALYATAENGKPVFGALPIAQGGTGAVTATAALEKLGAMPKSGGEMSGRLTVSTGINVKGDAWNAYGFKGTDDRNRGSMMVSNENTMMFNVIHPEAGKDVNGDYFEERYKLPEPTAGLTADQWYHVITNRNPERSRSMLGIGYTVLSGTTAADGSTAHNNAYGSYSAFVVMGAPAQGSSRMSLVIPAAEITTEQVRYQIADSTDFVSFYVWRSGATLYIKKYQGNGSVLAVYGMN